MKTLQTYLNRILKMLATLILVTGTQSFVLAEEIRVPVGQQASDEPAIKLPRQGLLKTKVAEMFGEPISKTDPVGKPPISSWKYPEFVVYFSDDYVIHSVRVFHPKPETTTTTTSE